MPDVSRETMERLDTYHDLTLKWTPKINLVSKAAQGDLWQRHFLDSAQLWQLRPTGAKSWIDLGSGGGFPGLVIAIIAADAAPKCAFLRTVAREVGIDVTVLTQRAEALEPNQADVVSARAVAPVSTLLDYAGRILRLGGICLFLKGRQTDKELEAAAEMWSFEVTKTPSLTDPDGAILKIKDISRER
jgi:16S rRNA (guanine527-N7)-methyltransferase